MCGIVAYVGKKEAYPILIKGLERLEYRGYDSAGIALYNEGINIFKKKGKVANLVEHVGDSDVQANIGIGHTRWATHGKPDDLNAPPHTSGNSDLAIIHNGIIENYASLKEALINEGHTFSTDTDTEVLIHLIEELQKRDNLSIEEATRLALTKVIGAFAIVVMDKKDPGKLVAARKASPLVIGIGEGEFFVASDATPIVEHTNQVVYLKNEEIAVIAQDGEFSLKTISNIKQTPFIQIYYLLY